MQDRLYPKYLLIPTILIFSVFFILPVIGGVYISLTNWDITKPVIRFIGFANYQVMFEDTDFVLAIKNTLVFTAAIVTLRNILALFLAIVLTQGLRTTTYLRTVFYIPPVLSYVVVGIMFTAIFQMNGTFNQILGFFSLPAKTEWIANPDTALLTVIAMDVWKWTGFHMVIYIAGLTAVPQDYYEASRIDGASFWGQLRYIVLPLLIPAFKINITQSIIGGFRVFEQVLTLTAGGPGHRSTVVGMMIYEYFGRGFYGRSTAMSMLLSVAVVVVTVAIRRYFTRKEMAY
jgi:raffinose/stachyose/melibiose transport system permease protein